MDVVDDRGSAFGSILGVDGVHGHKRRPNWAIRTVSTVSRLACNHPSLDRDIGRHAMRFGLDGYGGTFCLDVRQVAGGCRST